MERGGLRTYFCGLGRKELKGEVIRVVGQSCELVCDLVHVVEGSLHAKKRKRWDDF